LAAVADEQLIEDEDTVDRRTLTLLAKHLICFLASTSNTPKVRHNPNAIAKFITENYYFQDDSNSMFD
jgi:hypothetical protein